MTITTATASTVTRTSCSPKKAKEIKNFLDYEIILLRLGTLERDLGGTRSQRPFRSAKVREIDGIPFLLPKIHRERGAGVWIWKPPAKKIVIRAE